MLGSVNAAQIGNSSEQNICDKRYFKAAATKICLTLSLCVIWQRDESVLPTVIAQWCYCLLQRHTHTHTLT